MITEIQKLQRAKLYMDKLAEGVDPFTGSELAGDMILNNIKLSRCFFYVAEVLQQVIANGGAVGKKGRTILLDTEKISNHPISQTPLRITEFLKGVSNMCGTGSQIPATLVTNWLEEIGLLEKKQRTNERVMRTPTKQGMQLGILTEEHKGVSGPYEAVVYNGDAQRFILDHLETLINQWNAEHASNQSNAKDR